MFWSPGLNVHNEITNIMPNKIKNKIKLSEKILFAVEDKLNELMRFDNDEDTRFSGTLSLYNVLL